jgi:mannitol-1-/sugar-/sorbitol-6-/2-deoxyglucose-6-phosphatase
LLISSHFCALKAGSMLRLDTVIFDMDGLLIDSEPIWYEAGAEVLSQYGKQLTKPLYEKTMGLRTNEWLQYWYSYFQIPPGSLQKDHETIELLVEEKIRKKGKALPGIEHIFQYFLSKKYKIGLATSSSLQIAGAVTDVLRIKPYLQAVCSAEHLAYGKPHPQVFMNCAEQLQSDPLTCICFEDSFNGLIAAKAAKMKCVVVPAHSQLQDSKWGAADLKISSLQNFNDLLLMRFN